MADNRNDESRGSSWNDRDRWRGDDRGSSDAERARPGWGSIDDAPRGDRFEGGDRVRREGGFFERAGQQVRSWLGDDDGDRSRREWDHGASGVRGQDWRGSTQQSGQHVGYNDMSGMMGGFGNQRFASGQDDHYLSWRNRQIEELDRDYRDYCREREQQFRQDFDSWRSSRKGQAMSEGGSAATGETAKAGRSSTGFIASDPTPEPTDSTGRESPSGS